MLDVIVTIVIIATLLMEENVKYPIAPANPLAKATAENAVIESAGSLNKSAITALLVFSYMH